MVKKYCDLKHYLKHEHNAYYRLLKDHLCTSLMFSSLPKCFLVPKKDSPLFKKLDGLKENSEELDKAVKKLILKGNLDLKTMSTTTPIVNIEGKIIDDTAALLKNVENTTSAWVPWENNKKVEKKPRSYNTVFIYNGTDFPVASKEAEREPKTKAKSKSVSSGQISNFEGLVSLINVVSDSNKEMGIVDVCAEVQKLILCKLHHLEHHTDLLNKIMVYAYYKEDTMISLLSVVKMIPKDVFDEIMKLETDDVVDSFKSEYPQFLFKVKGYDELASSVRNMAQEIKKNKKQTNFSINQHVEHIEHAYKKLCSHHLEWTEKLLFDELKYMSQHHPESCKMTKFRHLMSVMMCNKNIVYFKELNAVKVIQKELNESMEKFIESEFFLYVQPVEGGAKMQHSMENVVKSLKSKIEKLTQAVDKIENHKLEASHSSKKSTPTNTPIQSPKASYVHSGFDFNGFGGEESDSD